MIAFEATRPSLFYQPYIFLLIFAFFAYAIFLLANCVIDIIKTYKTEKRIKIKDYILPLIFSGGLLLAFTYTGIMYFSTNVAYIEIYEKYKSGEYEIVEGTVENSIIFRGVKVSRGTCVKNSIIMQDCEIGENVVINCSVLDKNVVVRDCRVLSGHETKPYFAEKGIMI